MTLSLFLKVNQYTCSQYPKYLCDKIFKGKNPQQYYFYISWFKTSWQNVATRKKEQGVTFKIEKVCLKYERIKTLSHQVSAMQFTETQDLLNDAYFQR